jgi:hypothetical protein
MTLQTSAPLDGVPLNNLNRPISTFVHYRAQNEEYADNPLQGGLDMDQPYQRGSVWTTEQRQLLIKSLLLGVPTGAIITNDRFGGRYTNPEGKPDWRYAVVDGKQRVTTILMWFDDEFAVPSSWFRPEHVVTTEDTDDGPYVRNSGLTLPGQRIFSMSATVAVSEAQLKTVEEEAALFLLVNLGGTDVEAAITDQAAQIANGTTL